MYLRPNEKTTQRQSTLRIQLGLMTSQ